MEKRLTAAQAAALVKDGCTLVTTGFNGFGCPEDLMMALAEHYDKTGHPRDLTLVKCTSQGDGKGPGHQPPGRETRNVPGIDPLPYGL